MSASLLQGFNLGFKSCYAVAKSVVPSHFFRELVDLGVRDRLSSQYLLLYPFIVCQVCYDYSNQCKSARDEGNDDVLHRNHPFLAGVIRYFTSPVVSEDE